MMYLIGLGLAVLLVGGLVLSLLFRTVVEPNKVHVVQTTRKTTSYGSSHAAGNVYMNWPSFLPIIGIKRVILPVSNFSIKLDGYEAYDKDRAPFDLDVVGFFVIKDTSVAAVKASSFEELKHELVSIMQGAARTILAKHEVNEIMVERATFGEAFTKEVDSGLEAWGVTTVKNMELMDIRDGKGSKIISDIMAKKASEIEYDSRKTVAENKKKAEMAEIEARQEVEVREQEAAQVVGERTAAQEQAVGIARERSQQEIKEQARTTKQKEMEVISVERQREAEISRAAEIVKAEEDRSTTILRAEGDLQAKQLEAQGIKAEGEATAEAKRLFEMATVSPQLELATGIGENEKYQSYMINIRRVEAEEAIGIEQAKALHNADVKVIANSGTAGGGLEGARSIFSSATGQNVGAMLEGLKNTPEGAAILAKVTGALANGHANQPAE